MVASPLGSAPAPWDRRRSTRRRGYRRPPVKIRLGRPDTARARARWWGFEPGVVQLVLNDQATVPEPDELRGWLDDAARAGATKVRTGALFAGAAERFADAGFDVVDTLVLLRIQLDRRGDEPTVTRPAPAATAATTGPLRPRHHAVAAEIDRLAFGPPWANDVDDLDEIRQATPTHRGRGRFLPGSGWRRPLVGFAITGAASGQGYLQRLAVHPDHQRGGHGRALTVDAVEWMGRRRLTSGLVNTAATNTPALELYRSVGFEPLPERLVVMQRATA